jgi:hypothetical protein
MKTEFHSISLPIQSQYYTFSLFNQMSQLHFSTNGTFLTSNQPTKPCNYIYLPSMFISYLIFDITIFTPTWSSAISDRCCCVELTHTVENWTNFRPDSAEPKLAYSFGLQGRTCKEKCSHKPDVRQNTRTIETFHGMSQEEKLDLEVYRQCSTVPCSSR